MKTTHADIASRLLETLAFALDRNPRAKFWCQRPGDNGPQFCTHDGRRWTQENASLNPDGADCATVALRLLEAMEAGVTLFAWCPAQAGLVALDLDRHEGKPDGVANLASWLSGWLWPGETLPTWATDPTAHPAHVRTPGGGFHLYFEGLGLSKKVAVAESVELMSGPAWLAAPESLRGGKAPGVYSLHGNLQDAPRLADCPPLQRAVKDLQREEAQRAQGRAETKAKRAARPLVSDRGQASPETVAGWVEQNIESGECSPGGRNDAAKVLMRRAYDAGYTGEDELVDLCFSVGSVGGFDIRSLPERELHSIARHHIAHMRG